MFGVPVRQQSLFYYPDMPQQDPGLHLFEDHHSFVQDILKAELVLTSGEFSSWARFCVIFLPGPDKRRVFSKLSSNRFHSIADIKQTTFDDQELQVNGLSKQEHIGSLLDENCGCILSIK